jgi:hypothetical protein
VATKHLPKLSTQQTPFVHRYGGRCGGFPPCRTNERAIEFIKTQGTELETRDASEVPGEHREHVLKRIAELEEQKWCRSRG